MTQTKHNNARYSKKGYKDKKLTKQKLNFNEYLLSAPFFDII